MKRPAIFLIGFMGSGKTHWGTIWSEKYKLPFLDLDDAIEKQEGLTIAAIFQKYGEQGFREMEKRQLRKALNPGGLLIACGGGTPCFQDNMNWMKKNGIVVYLRATPEYLLTRVINERAKRPLLKEIDEEELLLFIQKKLQARSSVYQQADLIVDAQALTQNSLDVILEKSDLPPTKKTSF